jgi:glucose-1-phosphate cytidylyltransferase
VNPMGRASEISTIILCGGRGTRAHPHTMEVPKPMMDVAGRPIVRHVMEIYAGQGFTRFVLAAGFKYESLRDYARTLPDEWDVEVIDTGEDTDKADRIAACRDRVDDVFFATYSDGVGNVDLHRLFEFHTSHDAAATITVVPLPSQYGTVDSGDDGQVKAFVERPRLMDHWINAGFFVLSGRAFDHWTGPDLERDVFPALGDAGLLYAYRHDGFWRSMDTYKESLELDEIARASETSHGQPPWLTSSRVASS